MSHANLARDQRICAAVVSDPCISTTELCERFGLTGGTVYQALARNGIGRKTRAGKWEAIGAEPVESIAEVASVDGRPVSARLNGIAACFSIPVKTSNPLNGSGGTTRGARFAAAARAKKQRNAARECAMAAVEVDLAGIWVRHTRHFLRYPLRVTLTRVSVGTLDAFDGLPASLKRIADGICDALGVDDGDASKVVFAAKQRKGSRGEYSVEVEIAEDVTP